MTILAWIAAVTLYSIGLAIIACGALVFLKLNSIGYNEPSKLNGDGDLIDCNENVCRGFIRALKMMGACAVVSCGFGLWSLASTLISR